MRKFSYFLCFLLVAIPTIFMLFVSWPMSLLGKSIPGFNFFTFIFSFGSPTPQMILPIIPTPIVLLLNYAMMFLICRRLWFFFIKKQGIPLSYQGFQKWLGIAGAGIYSLAILTLVLSIVFKAPSGVPAGMLLIPPMILIPWAFFITELFSFHKQFKNAP